MVDFLISGIFTPGDDVTWKRDLTAFHSRLTQVYIIDLSRQIIHGIETIHLNVESKSLPVEVNNLGDNLTFESYCSLSGVDAKGKIA